VARQRQTDGNQILRRETGDEPYIVACELRRTIYTRRESPHGLEELKGKVTLELGSQTEVASSWWDGRLILGLYSQCDECRRVARRMRTKGSTPIH